MAGAFSNAFSNAFDIGAEAPDAQVTGGAFYPTEEELRRLREGRMKREATEREADEILARDVREAIDPLAKFQRLHGKELQQIFGVLDVLDMLDELDEAA